MSEPIDLSNVDFHEIARRWNRRGGAWALFPEFLRIVYQHRVQEGEELRSQRTLLMPDVRQDPQVVRLDDFRDREAA